MCKHSDHISLQALRAALGAFYHCLMPARCLSLLVEGTSCQQAAGAACGLHAQMHIWCGSPVFTLHCTRDAVPPAKDSRTLHVLAACLPLHREEDVITNGAVYLHCMSNDVPAAIFNALAVCKPS